MSNSANLIWGTGRRKTSIARVRIIPNGKGKIFINKQILEDYFKGLSHLITEVVKPLEVTKAKNCDVRVNVKGGGITGQAEAIRHGIARALAKISESNKIILRKYGFLTRDSRMVERKKPGQPKARKRFQFSKR